MHDMLGGRFLHREKQRLARTGDRFIGTGRFEPDVFHRDARLAFHLNAQLVAHNGLRRLLGLSNGFRYGHFDGQLETLSPAHPGQVLRIGRTKSNIETRIPAHGGVQVRAHEVPKKVQHVQQGGFP